MPATPTSNPSPKQRFQQSGDNVGKHRNLIDLADFQRSVDFAMLEYQATLARRVVDERSALMAGVKLQGALEFLQEFRLLSENPKIEPLPAAPSLNHRV